MKFFTLELISNLKHSSNGENLDEIRRSKKFRVTGAIESYTDYYMVKIPQDIREFLDLKGGEYFEIRTK